MSPHSTSGVIYTASPAHTKDPLGRSSCTASHHTLQRQHQGRRRAGTKSSRAAAPAASQHGQTRPPTTQPGRSEADQTRDIYGRTAKTTTL